MHIFLIILGIVILLWILIALCRWLFSDGVGFFEAWFIMDFIGDIFEAIGDCISSIGDD